MHVAGCRCVAFCCAPLDVRVVTRESGAFSFDAFFRIVRVLFVLCCCLFWFGFVSLFCLSLVAVVAFFVVVSVLLSPRFSPALPVFVFGFLARRYIYTRAQRDPRTPQRRLGGWEGAAV